MLKIDEANMPDSCWNKTKDDEYVFILRERDPQFAAIVMEWARQRVEHGQNKEHDAKIVEARKIAYAAIERVKK